MRLPVPEETKWSQDAAMSFGEIGRRLGISDKGAWMLYASAMRKLHARPGAFRQLRQVVALRRQLEDRRDTHRITPRRQDVQ